MLQTKETMIYMGMRQFTSSKGNLLNIVTLADPVKYENYDFFVDLKEFNAGNIVNGSPVTAFFELAKYNGNTDVRLKAVSAAQVKETVSK